MSIFNQDKKKVIEDAYKRGYEKAEQFYIRKLELEKQKIVDDYDIEMVKLKLEISSIGSDVQFYKNHYETMKKTHHEVMAHELKNKAITNRLLYYANEKSMIEPNMLQQFGVLASDASNNLLENKK
jgi:hypothetical protein